MNRWTRGLVAFCVLLALLQLPPGRTALGDQPTIVYVVAVREAAEEWTFAVTVRHADHDPDHWVDWWHVRTPEGRELGRRVLLHSHVDEQPFTRDARVRIPAHIRVVAVEAHDSLHGLGGATTVDLGQESGPRYRVRRAN